MLLEPIERCSKRLFELACQRDLEGVVAKWKYGSYQSEGSGTSWFKSAQLQPGRRSSRTIRRSSSATAAGFALAEGLSACASVALTVPLRCCRPF
jgi:ATP-dependent DNA ligase